jgi:hypothetical protein
VLKKLIRGWGCAQVVGCLPSKCKVLSSNPGTLKKESGDHYTERVQNLCSYVSQLKLNQVNVSSKRKISL